MFRLLWLAAELCRGMLTYLPKVLGVPEKARSEARARWMQSVASRLQRVLHVEVDVQGPVPVRGLLISNHLSYVDIMVFAAHMPVVFISKSEVARWPIFGWYARKAGSLFVRRDQRADAARLGEEMRAVLELGRVLILFPEGTSSDGQTVLPFKSSLFAPVAGTKEPLTAAHIQYTLADGNPGEDVCYWGDMTMGPHLINLLGKKSVQARVRFSRLNDASADRKELARQLHAEVMKLKAGA
jgi:1-acyl-sn-glycerol-3-phosphate acyltransferase